MKISTILATTGAHVLTVRPDHTVQDAAELLVDHHIDALVVVDESGDPVGIISERDMLRAGALEPNGFGQPVSEFMTRELVVGSPDDELKSVMHTMTERRIRHLPILDHGHLIGMVSIGEIVKVLHDTYKGQVDTLQTQLIEGQV